MHEYVLRSCLASVALLFLTHLDSSTQEKPSAEPSAIAPILSIYPDKARGLEQLAKDILRAAKQEDTGRFDALLASLVLADPAKWFAEVFEGSSLQDLARAYEQNRPNLPRQLRESFQKIIQERTTGPVVSKFETSCDDNAGEVTFPVLMARSKPVPLYELRFFKGDRLFRIWAFAYVDGGFRYVGNLRPPESLSPSKLGEEVLRMKLGGHVAAAKLVHRVQPEYPRVARDEHLQGTVRLHALIGKDGLIRDLRVLRGYCSLAESSLKAVRQWRYSPTLLNGQPVEVDTTIDVIFSLNR